ncbi:hypothetical protein KSP40_PGU013806 [Platanthera guangdongensis]|uniref:Uncharacterized protein n=1 Tax=Platanthera guangdongensis TaxID=2320717 RepID=A0ABR2M7U8_9ASPA
MSSQGVQPSYLWRRERRQQRRRNMKKAARVRLVEKELAEGSRGTWKAREESATSLIWAWICVEDLGGPRPPLPAGGTVHSRLLRFSPNQRKIYRPRYKIKDKTEKEQKKKNLHVGTSIEA